MTPKRTPPKAAASKSTVNDVQRELLEKRTCLNRIMAELAGVQGRLAILERRLERSQRR